MNIVQVLGIIIASDGGLPEVIEDILRMEEDELKLMLCGLLSMMKDEKDENGECLNKGVSYVINVIPHFAHASFGDNLFNSSCSGPFHVIIMMKLRLLYRAQSCTHYAIDLVLEVSNS